MSDVKSITRNRARASHPYRRRSESDSSIESISDLAVKIGKMDKYDDVHGNYDAASPAGVLMQTPLSSDPNLTHVPLANAPVKPSDLATQLSMPLNIGSDANAATATPKPDRVQHRVTLLDHFNVEITNCYGVLADVEMDDATPPPAGTSPSTSAPANEAAGDARPSRRPLRNSALRPSVLSREWVNTIKNFA